MAHVSAVVLDGNGTDFHDWFMDNWFLFRWVDNNDIRKCKRGLIMSVRDKSYYDYGISDDEVKEMFSICQDKKFSQKHELMLCAEESNKQLAIFLFASIVNGESYERILSYAWIPICKNDFYGYRRKTLALFREMITKE